LRARRDCGVERDMNPPDRFRRGARSGQLLISVANACRLCVSPARTHSNSSCDRPPLIEHCRQAGARRKNFARDVNVNLLLNYFLLLPVSFAQEITSLFLRMKAERKKSARMLSSRGESAMTEWIARLLLSAYGRRLLLLFVRCVWSRELQHATSRHETRKRNRRRNVNSGEVYSSPPF